jgi:hypothetical protein
MEDHLQQQQQQPPECDTASSNINCTLLFKSECNTSICSSRRMTTPPRGACQWKTICTSSSILLLECNTNTRRVIRATAS